MAAVAVAAAVGVTVTGQSGPWTTGKRAKLNPASAAVRGAGPVAGRSSDSSRAMSVLLRVEWASASRQIRRSRSASAVTGSSGSTSTNTGRVSASGPTRRSMPHDRELPPGPRHIHRDGPPPAPPRQATAVHRQQQVEQRDPVPCGGLAECGGQRLVDAGAVVGEGRGGGCFGVAVVRQGGGGGGDGAIGEAFAPVLLVLGERRGLAFGGHGGRVVGELGLRQRELERVVVPARQGRVERPEFLGEELEAEAVGGGVVDDQEQVGEVRVVTLVDEDGSYRVLRRQVERAVAQVLFQLKTGRACPVPRTSGAPCPRARRGRRTGVGVRRRRR